MTAESTDHERPHTAQSSADRSNPPSAVITDRTIIVLRESSATALRSRFYAGYTWLILRNVLGWGLILISFVAGPLVPGPGGIPLFLVGFALISFPGKRRFTARVLRGRPLRFRTKLFSRIVWAVALAASIAALTSTRPWTSWPLAQPSQTVAVVGTYLLGTLIAWLAVQLTLRLTNVLLRVVPRARRRVRPGCTDAESAFFRPVGAGATPMSTGVVRTGSRKRS